MKDTSPGHTQRCQCNTSLHIYQRDLIASRTIITTSAFLVRKNPPQSVPSSKYFFVFMFYTQLGASPNKQRYLLPICAKDGESYVVRRKGKGRRTLAKIQGFILQAKRIPRAALDFIFLGITLPQQWGSNCLTKRKVAKVVCEMARQNAIQMKKIKVTEQKAFNQPTAGI